MYKNDMETARKRVEAWWNRAVLDRAVIQIKAPRDASNPTPKLERTDDPKAYFTDPEVVMTNLERYLEATYFGGEAFPVVFPVSIRMAAILANYLGSPMELQDANTVWSGHMIEKWEDHLEFKIDPQNEWWKLSRTLLEAGAKRASGYFVGVPDLNGPTEILCRLRGPEKLALDLIDHPDKIMAAMKEINRAWFGAWQELTKITQQTGGYFNWMGIWSDLPSADLQSDSSCLISSSMFNEYFLPFIEEQTNMIDRTIYHLDGPGAVRHLDALLELPKLTAVQWVQGSGEKPTVEWIPLIKRIQAARKLAYIYCEKGEVKTLLKELDPEGLMMVTTCGSPDEADDLLKSVGHWTPERAS